jgi:hypothetical protein
MTGRMKRSQPNIKEVQTLRTIAVQDGLLVTYVDGKAHYSTARGIHINTKIAERLIQNRWVVGDDGDALFAGCRPQRYRCLRP